MIARLTAWVREHMPLPVSEPKGESVEPTRFVYRVRDIRRDALREERERTRIRPIESDLFFDPPYRDRGGNHA